MIDVAGLALAPDECELTRNYQSPAQLGALTASIHALRDPPLMIAVDHEGGRVQRFVEGFTRLPSMRALGRVYDREPALAANLASAVGVVLAAELRGHGVDFSFAPVLDIDFGSSSVIGDRAFHATAAGVTALAGGLVAGMARMGMGAVGKHFPGHGYVRADSHHEVPVDERDLATIEANDLVPYKALVGKGLAGVMPAHVIYPKVDSRPAGFSTVWLKDICVVGWHSTASCSATTCRWRAQALPGGSSSAARRRCRRVATWSSSATRVKPRSGCSTVCLDTRSTRCGPRGCGSSPRQG
jgi:beta-glucosidase-like glycosyl hydrolase